MILRNAKEFKALEGKVVYGMPSGSNNTRYWDGKPKEFSVVKAKRKYVSMLVKGFITPDDYDPSCHNGEHGYGYKFFETLDDFNAYVESQRMNAEIRSHFNNWNAPELTQQEAIVVLEIIENSKKRKVY